MARIAHPRPQLGRQLFLSIEFIDGTAEVGELHPEHEQALLQHGATIEIDAVALETLTVRELRDIASVECIDLPAKTTKSEIIAILHQSPLPTLTDSGEFLAAHIVSLQPGKA